MQESDGEHSLRSSQRPNSGAPPGERLLMHRLPEHASRAARLRIAAHHLRLELIAAEVLEALERRSIRPILLKGPVVSRWLYRPDELRTYADVDLLVPPDARLAAEDVLTRMGLRPGQWGWMEMSRSWYWGSREAVDLHTGLFGIGMHAGDAYVELAGMTEPLTLGRVTARQLAEPGRLLHVAIHAAQDGGAAAKSMEDLRRAIGGCGAERWEKAAALARAVDAEGVLSAGLRLDPRGADLADRLGLPASWPARIGVLARPGRPLTKGFMQLAALPPHRRAPLVLRTIAPSRAYMERRSTLARHGRAGLALAYAWRVVWMAFHLVPAFRWWLQARRPEAP
ncbi:MAG: nucleotidyltransferase family protein [Actinomycetota bacterium]|nr:nucleotidyltransferase family protein [Actinomycetota bacterium]